MSEHRLHPAAAPPRELLGSSRLLAESLDIAHCLGRKYVLVEEEIAWVIQDPGTMRVKDGMQRDVAFQGWAEGQTAGDTQFIANPLAAAQQS